MSVSWAAGNSLLHTQPHPHMVLEARLVSSCLSFPSRARPRFSRLSLSSGVTVYTLQNVELGDTWSLGGGDKRTRLLEGPGWARGQLLPPSLAPSLFGHRSQGSRFWLNPFKEINSSDTTNCGGNALESGDSLGRLPPSPHILLGLLFSALELQLFAGRGSIIGSSQGCH